MTTTNTESIAVIEPVDPIAHPRAPLSEETVRRVPAARWGLIVLMTVLLTSAGVAAWEVKMRSLGLHAGDLDDTNDHWAEVRRAVSDGPADQVVIVGDSRIWFDTDPAEWQRRTGVRPRQLGLPGTNGRYLLADLAADPRVRGLVVVGLAEQSFFRDQRGLRGDAPGYVAKQSLAQQSGFVLHRALSRHLAFLDDMYRPQTLLRWMDIPSRPGVRGVRGMPWKLSESLDERETYLWPRLVTDAGLRERARATWMANPMGAGPPVADDQIRRTIADAARDVARIRARGGEVVFIRPPSAGPLLDAERRVAPREKVWDRLIAETGTVGIHWEDYAAMQNLDVPEWSHLSRESATVFTRAYVSAIMEKVAWLRDRQGQR